MDFDFCLVVTNKNNLHYSNSNLLQIWKPYDIITTNIVLLIVTRLGRSVQLTEREIKGKHQNPIEGSTLHRHISTLIRNACHSNDNNYLAYYIIAIKN